MLPLFKVFSLVLRVFSKPLLAYAKSAHKENHGHFSNRMESRINKKLMFGSADDFFVKAVTDDIAIEKGIEFFYEILVYSILIGLPCYEMYKSAVSEQKKQQMIKERYRFQDRFQDLEHNLSEVTHELQDQKQENTKLQLNYQEQLKSLQITLQEQNLMIAQVTKYLHQNPTQP